MPLTFFPNGLTIESGLTAPAPPFGMFDTANRLERWELAPADVRRPINQRRSLTFDCYRTPAGDRVFWPSEGWDTFLWRACNAGAAVMDAYPDPSADPMSVKYHAVMAILYAKARHTRPYLSANFLYAKDLRLAPNSGGGPADARGVLPLNLLGPPPCGATEDWTVNSFLASSRALCGEAAEPAECIAAALYGAARAHPLPLPGDPAERLRAFRRALFADPPAPFPGDEMIADLQNAFFEVYHGRVNRRPDETAADFLAWAGTGRHDNIRKLVLGKLTRAGSWSEEEIEAGLEEMWWRSVRYAGAALSHAAAYWLFESAPLGELTPRERALFRLMYFCGPACGGPPLAMLHDRFTLLAPWLADLWCEPDTPRMDVLFTLLAYYADMARRRRAADGLGSATGGSPAVELAPAPDGGTALVDARDELDGAAARFAAARGFRCRCDQARWACRVEENETARVTCAACRWTSDPIPYPEWRLLPPPLDAA